MDVDALNLVYLACQRSVVSEQLAMIPAKERKTYEELKRYVPKYKTDPDIAWTDAFPGASAWLSDRDIIRIEKEKSEPEHHNRGLGSF